MISKTLRASDGRTVRYLEAGDGPPLLLFHGVGMRAETWAPQYDRLAPHARIIAPDMAGHGSSDALEGAPRLPDYVAWAARFIEALEIGPVALAGHSMGALIVLGLAVEFPHLVDRICLLNAVYRRDPAAAEAVRSRAAALEYGDDDPEATLDRWFYPGEHPALRLQVRGWLADVNPDGYRQAYTAFSTGDAVYADALPRIRCPALVLTGELDRNSNPEMTRRMAEGIPGARAVVIPGARHMTSLTDPEAVNRELQIWLAERRQDVPDTARALHVTDRPAG